MAKPVFEFEFIDKCVADLESCIDQGPIILWEGQETRSLNEELVAQVRGLKIIIRANEHPPPHFHVKCNGEENSFSIHDGSPLRPNNGLRRYFINIKKWHSKNRKKLVKSWNRTRPTDCPVGEIR